MKKSQGKKFVDSLIEENIKPYFTKHEDEIKKYSSKNKKKRLYLLHGETVIKLKAKANTKPSDFSYAIPSLYNNQVPILFDLRDDTSNKIINYQI